MPKIVIEGDTQDEMMDTLINLGIAQLNLRQTVQQQEQPKQDPQQEQSNCEQVPQGGTEKTPKYKARFAHTDQK